ncbi:replication initiation protein [Subdoligranulum variabile]|nr:replication initiation protein [Subdoligranulum variabile]UWP68542.1 replication initiation protein [Subdoligranulum variabile]
MASRKTSTEFSSLLAEDFEEQEQTVATYGERGNQTVVRKSNELIQNAMYNLTLSQQKLMLHIFAMIKPSDTELPRYEMSIYEFLKLCGVDPHNGSMYNQVKKNISDIASTPVQWIRIEGTQKITMFRWIDGSTIDKRTGKITLTLSPFLKPHLIQLKEFYTTMDVTYIMLMKSQYSVRIYELCKSYQNLYLQNKAKGKPLVWDIDNLRKQVDCSATNWAHIRRTVLDKAKSEINGHTDILFDYAVYKKAKSKVVEISVQIEQVEQTEAAQNLTDIASTISKRRKRKNHPIAETVDEDDSSVMSFGYVSSPETTIPYSFGKRPAELKKEIQIRAELASLKNELTVSELEAVDVIINTMTSMAGKARGKNTLIDGGDQQFFELMNEIIYECKGLRRWFLGVAGRYAKVVIPVAKTKASPVLYLWKSILEDMDNYRLYTSCITQAESSTSQEDIYEAHFVEAEAEDDSNDVLVPQDADTKKSMIQALQRFIDEKELDAKLTPGQKEAYEDILNLSAYFCRRNVKSKDEGMMEGKANMQFLNSLNKCIMKYGSLTLLFETLSTIYDYDTYWKKVNRDDRIRNPKLLFQSEIEHSLLMPFGVIENQKAQQQAGQNNGFTRDWLSSFD